MQIKHQNFDKIIVQYQFIGKIDKHFFDSLSCKIYIVNYHSKRNKQNWEHKVGHTYIQIHNHYDTGNRFIQYI